jgi:hypothetical protein
MKKLSNKRLQDDGIELIGLDEVFTQIRYWNNYYISNYGRLAHDKNKKINVIKPSISQGGYLTYTLYKPARTYRGQTVRTADGKAKTKKQCIVAHRLVAQMYIVNPYPCEYSIDDLEVHHKDSNRQNNYCKNLMYLCKQAHNRTDHDFIHTIKKVAIYNEDRASYYSYRDIEMLIKRLKVNILEFIDTIRYSDTYIRDGKWNTYKVNDSFVGIQWRCDKGKANNI